MPPLKLVVAALAACAATASLAQQSSTTAATRPSGAPETTSGAAQPPGPVLDFEFFKARIEPIFTTKRPGNARCVSCHAFGTTMRLQPLPDGGATWKDTESRANFEVLRARVVPGNPDESRLLRHPLAESAGGDPHHDGGKHWTSKNDPEWQTLAAWVRGATLTTAPKPGPLHARIVQTNSAGDNVHIIDPETNKVVGEITGIEVGHGAAAAPDGGRIYVSNEADSTLDVVDARTLRVTSKIPLSGHPNNISVSRDGRRVYIAIREAAGAVDVVDTAELARVKSIPIKGAGHNTYVTPDGRYVIAGSVVGKTLTVIDQKTEEPIWTLFQEGVRPMAFETNADGSTKRIYVQLSDFHGFAVVDFQQRKEVARVELPHDVPAEKIDKGPFNGSPSHGLGVAPDGKSLWVTSRPNARVYTYTLPDLKLLPDPVDLGGRPDWVTFTPDTGPREEFCFDRKQNKRC